MFKAVFPLQRQQHSKLMVRHELKHVIADKHKSSINRSETKAKHFEKQFQDVVEHGVHMFEGSPKSLDALVTAKEAETAFARLNNNRACGYDLIQANL